MKSAGLLIAAIIIILMMPACLVSINEFRMAEQVDEYNVTTGGGVTEADVVLSQDLFSDETRNADATSNLSSDAPIASTYASATNTLTITGLEASADRRLTVTYQIDALSDYWGAGTGTRVWPILLILGVLGVVTGAVIYATRRGGE